MSDRPRRPVPPSSSRPAPPSAAPHQPQRPSTPHDPVRPPAEPKLSPDHDSTSERFIRGLGGRVTPKVPSKVRRRFRTPGFIRHRMPEVTPEVRERWELISGYVQAIGGIIFIFLLIAFALSTLTRLSLTEPKDGKGVMERVEDPSDVAMSVETVRIKRIDGVKLRLDSVRALQIDTQRNKFRVQANGVADEALRIVGDSKTAIYQQGDNAPGKLRSHPTEQQVRPLLPEDIRDRAGELVTNRATVVSQRGWLITWHPTRQDILRMLSADLLKLKSTDIDAIRAGKYRVVQRDRNGRGIGTATVIRNSRQLYQANVELEVNGARLEILVTYRAFDTGRLKDLDLNRRVEEEVT